MDSLTDELLLKLTQLPAPDFSKGINLKELQLLPMTIPNLATQPPFNLQALSIQSPTNSLLESPFNSATPTAYNNMTHIIHDGSMSAQSLDYMSYQYLPFPSPPTTPLNQYFPLDWHVNSRQATLDNGNQRRRMSMPYIPIRRHSTSSSISSSSSLQCPNVHCGQVFEKIQNLTSHSRCHLQSPPHPCLQCTLKFKRSTDLARHVKSLHTPDELKKFGCSFCCKRFGRSDSLKRHLSSRLKNGNQCAYPPSSPSIRSPAFMDTVVE